MPGSVLDAENTGKSIDTLFLPLMKLLVQLGKKDNTYDNKVWRRRS